MQDVVPISPRGGRGDAGSTPTRSILTRLPDYLPRGNTLDDKAWHRRHRMLEWVLFLHVPESRDESAAALTRRRWSRG